jgi:2-C-methyl-D-erythritol 2,4-cyclodiphosphate synthase
MTRIGLGYDSHRFDPSRPLILGGVRVSDTAGLAGHSDADVVLHAITDALLGAAGMDDIGELFPDTDPTLKNADSAMLLTEVLRRIGEKGFRPANCDVTILAERPKLSPHKPAMRQNIARLLGLPADGVAVKAKTNEGMGAIGRAEGMAAMAVVLLQSR